MLTCEAKVLYGIMLDRMGLSVRNRWFDEEDRVYIIFTIEEIMELLCCRTQKAVKLLKELDTENGIGLIEKKRPGLGRPNVIYVKNFMVREADGPGQHDVPEGMQEAATGGGGTEGMHGEGFREAAFTVLQDGERGQGDAAVRRDTGNQKYRILKTKNQEFSESKGNSPEMAPAAVITISQDEERKEGAAIYRSMKSQNSSILKIKNQEFPESEGNGSEMDSVAVTTAFQGKERGQDGAAVHWCAENQNCSILKIENREFPGSKGLNCEKQNPGVLKNEIPEFPESKPNDTDTKETNPNDTEFSNTDTVYPNLINPSGGFACHSDAVDEMAIYREAVRDRISYGHFAGENRHLREEVDELVELVVDVMMMPDSKTLRIAGVKRPVAVVKNRFMKLGQPHIEYVMGCLQKNTSRIENIKAYLLTTLYNATMTIDHYYRAEVNHDMYGRQSE